MVCFKGQSAIEYLMTYGWMLLVVAVVGSAVFGLAQSDTPDTVSGFTGADVVVEDFGVTADDELGLEVRDGSGQGIVVSEVNVSDPDTGEYVFKEFTGDTRVSVGDEKLLQLPNVTRTDGSNVLNVEITYSSGGLENLVVQGTISGNLELERTREVEGPPGEHDEDETVVLSDSSSGWWNDATKPDLHVNQIESELEQGKESVTNVTVYGSNDGFGYWNVNVSLWSHEYTAQNELIQIYETSDIDWQDSISLGDMNGDGSLEVVSAAAGSEVIVWEWNESEELESIDRADLGDYVRTVSLGDVTGDSSLEVVSGDANGNVTVWAWNESNQLEELGSVSNASDTVVSLGDLTGDGSLEVVSAGHSEYDGFLSVWEWDSGDLNELDDYNHDEVIFDISLGDVNGDGEMEIVSSSEGSTDAVQVHEWDSTDDSLNNFYNVSDAGWSYSSSLGDLTGDGSLEVVSSNNGDIVARKWNESDELEDLDTYNPTDSISPVSLGDVTGDGSLEVVAVDDNMNDIGAVILEWTEDDEFEELYEASGEYEGTSVALGDLNNDGKLEVVAAQVDTDNWTGGVIRVWEWRGLDEGELIGSDSVVYDDADGESREVTFEWTPTDNEYNLTATVDHYRNYTSVFRTQDGSSAVGERLVQEVIFD